MKYFLPLLLLLSGCQSFRVHPFEIGVTLPYSENCRFKNVMTKQVREIDPLSCEAVKKRSFILTTEAWRIISTDLKNNCAANQCVQLRGQLDDLALEIDKGLQKIPW